MLVNISRLLPLAFLFATSLAAADNANPALAAAVDNPLRSADAKQRDQYRHPAQTLEFFGITPTMTVVEIWPGGGWYTDILGPYLASDGHYIAAHFPATSEVAYFTQSRAKFDAHLKANPVLAKAKVVDFAPPEQVTLAPPASVDAVLTFRNVHNWMDAGSADAAFAAMFAALKPGGILGVVEHRLPADREQDPKAETGYVREDVVIALAAKAGFKLVARSEVNANGKDLADHPKGVWTLPPRLALEEQDRDFYLAIGESDRMTLKFIKP